MIILSTTINLFLNIDKRSIVRIRKALENRTNMEDDRVSLLEQQLAQAKLIAEEADKKYEEVGHVPANKEREKLRAKGPFISLCRRRTTNRLGHLFSQMQKYLFEHFYGRNSELTHKETEFHFRYINNPMKV